jgi:serine/threonine protein kinase
MVVPGNSLIYLVPARNTLQHENRQKNEAETARNPYFTGLSIGDPSRIRTCNPRSRNPLLDRMRGRSNCVLDGLAPILLVAAEETSLGCVERLEHEYALKAELDADWAARPVALTHYNDRLTLVLEDPGGAPVDRLLGRPLDVSHFLRIAIPLAGALGRVHERGLIHKDIKPSRLDQRDNQPDSGVGRASDHRGLSLG